MNTHLMIEDLKQTRPGAFPQVDVIADLTPKKEFDVDSFFVIGHYEVEGHVLNFLFHIMALKIPFPLGRKYLSVVSVIDETTGYYYGKDALFGKRKVRVGKDGFSIEVPNGKMVGTWDRMKIFCTVKDMVVDIETRAVHYPIYPSGSSVFYLQGVNIHQYSVPYMETTGTFTVQGKTYKLNNNGYTWFDRQWQYADFRKNKDPRWTWLSIYLDNGDVLEIWKEFGEDGNNFASILHADGSQTNVKVAPSNFEESEYWYSEKSKQNYPTKWKVIFGDYDLEMVSSLKEQEIISCLAPLNKYEGAARVTGTVKGTPVKGHGVSEMIGPWKK